jgi:O-antigen ligase
MIRVALFVVVLTVYAAPLHALFPWLHVKLIDDFLMIVVLGYLVATRLARRTPPATSSLLRSPGLALGIFIPACILSGILNEVAPDVWLVQLRSYLLPLILMFGIGRSMVSTSEVIGAVQALLVIAFPVFLGGIWESMTGSLILGDLNRYGEEMLWIEGFRIQSFMGNPIDFGVYTLSTLALLLGMGLSRARWAYQIPRTFFFTLAAMAISSLLLAGSRGPAIAGIVGALALALTGKVKLKRSFKVLIAAGAVTLLFGKTLISRLGLLSLEYFQADEYRGVFLYKAAEAFGDHPLLGAGPGRFGGWVSINYEPSLLYSEYAFSTQGISSIDMFWPHLIVETGIIGTMAYCAMYLTVAASAWSQLREPSDETLESSVTLTLARALLFYVPAICIGGLFSSSLESQVCLTQLAVLFGLLAGHVADRAARQAEQGAQRAVNNP